MKITRQKLALSLMSASLAFSSAAAVTTQFVTSVYAAETAKKELLSQAVEEADRLVADGTVAKANELVQEYFNSELAKAKALLEDETASQDDVNTAWAALSDAIQMLDFTSNKDALISGYEAVKDLDVTGAVSDAAKTAFDNAVANAKEVIESATALTEQSIADATNQLAAAVETVKNELDSGIASAKAEADKKQPEVDSRKQEKDVNNYWLDRMSDTTVSQIQNANAAANAAKSAVEKAKKQADSASSLEEKTAALAALKAAQAQQDAAIKALDAIQLVTIYRLYNPNTGEHLYTQYYEEEVQVLVPLGWRYEDVAWYAPAESTIEVTRLYNPNAEGGDHHYTTDADEIAFLVKEGWRNEGPSFYADDDNSMPLYMLYNPNAKSGAHHLTYSIDEYNSLVKAGWRGENIKFYAK
jgi:hypothetical protein